MQHTRGLCTYVVQARWTRAVQADDEERPLNGAQNLHVAVAVTDQLQPRLPMQCRPRFPQPLVG